MKISGDSKRHKIIKLIENYFITSKTDELNIDSILQALAIYSVLFFLEQPSLFSIFYEKKYISINYFIYFEG